MKLKKRYFAAIAVAILLTIAGIFIYERMHVQLYLDEQGQSAYIIGGADGPTAIFVGGKVGQ